jgi:hypothetical protein
LGCILLPAQAASSTLCRNAGSPYPLQYTALHAPVCRQLLLVLLRVVQALHMPSLPPCLIIGIARVDVSFSAHFKVSLVLLFVDCVHELAQHVAASRGWLPTRRAAATHVVAAVPSCLLCMHACLHSAAHPGAKPWPCGPGLVVLQQPTAQHNIIQCTTLTCAGIGARNGLRHWCSARNFACLGRTAQNRPCIWSPATTEMQSGTR